MLRKLFFICLVLALGATIFVLPGTLVTSNGQTSFCGLSNASAQNNPCLPQEATISALQVENISLQATMTSMQATMSAIQSGVQPNPQEPGPAPVASVPGLPFYDDFSNNDNGWQLTSGASITQGELVVTGVRESNNFVTLPGIHANTFYLEVSVWGKGDGPQWGIALGDLSGQEGSAYYHFGYHYDNYLYVEDSTLEWPCEMIWKADFYPSQTPTRIALHLQNGQLEIFVDGELFTIIQVAPRGNQIGLGVADEYKNRDTIAHFDNLEVRASK
jgi:hypothetical protein